MTLSHGVEVEGELQGGVLAGLARSLLTSESFFTTKVSAAAGGPAGDALLAPQDPGGIALHRLAPGGDLLLTSGAYLAADVGVELVSEVQGGSVGNVLLSGTGLFLLRARGQGTVALAAHGAVHSFDLKPGERRAVDNGHLVAWSAAMPYTTGLASRYIASLATYSHCYAIDVSFSFRLLTSHLCSQAGAHYFTRLPLARA